MEMPDLDVLRLEDGDVLLVHTPRGELGIDRVERLGRSLGDFYRGQEKDVLVVLLPEGWTVEHLTEAEMEGYGWVRTEVKLD